MTSWPCLDASWHAEVSARFFHNADAHRDLDYLLSQDKYDRIIESFVSPVDLASADVAIAPPFAAVDGSYFDVSYVPHGGWVLEHMAARRVIRHASVLERAAIGISGKMLAHDEHPSGHTGDGNQLSAGSGSALASG